MNIQRIANRAVTRVNPDITVSIQVSTGYTTDAAGEQVPTYAAAVPLSAQVQSLTAGDLSQCDGLNIQGEKRAIYLNGNWNGVVREDGKGGDLITFPDGTVWLVVLVLENWGGAEGWVKVAVTRQMPA
jgi:hypothetical protein